jgi:hypothetical protein
MMTMFLSFNVDRVTDCWLSLLNISKHLQYTCRWTIQLFWLLEFHGFWYFWHKNPKVKKMVSKSVFLALCAATTVLAQAPINVVVCTEAL